MLPSGPVVSDEKPTGILMASPLQLRYSFSPAAFKISSLVFRSLIMRSAGLDFLELILFGVDCSS